jgi:hypothetical protein
MIISESLLSDIQDRKKKIDEKLENKSLVEILLNLFKKRISKEALLHSCRLEYESKRCGLESNFNKKEYHKICYRNLKDVWQWGLKNFKLDFDENFIIEIAKRVEPDAVTVYRKGRVRPSGPRLTPPGPEKLRGEMEKLMKNLEYGRNGIKEGRISPIEVAVLAHYHLTRIHPFDDGNGRTSRLIQNLILNNFSYPSTIIYKGQKDEYCDHLLAADEGYRFREGNGDFWNNLSEGEKGVYNYLASRINTSIDHILDGVYKK